MKNMYHPFGPEPEKECCPGPYHPTMCPPSQPPVDMCPPPSPVPPPIPPVRYIPGMNVQEQLCSMANHVNESINRWNQIQGECYKALDNMVGAAVNNDVYYAPDEVRAYAGYSSDDSCPYQIIEARAIDRSGRPIFMHLKAAFNNVTNTGAKQPMEDASFITSANAIMTAYNPADVQWHGPVLFNGDPGEAGEVVDGEYVCGWNRNGVLRVFPSSVDITVLKQNRMVNCIGPVIPILEEGEITYQAQNFTAVRGSIQALGWKKCNGNKVMFSCTNEDYPGMSVLSVAQVLKNMGVTTAVVTCYQSTYAQPSIIPPIQEENAVAAQGLTPEQQSALGLTGGMMYIGQISGSPLEWQLPQNGAFWVISKRPDHGRWPNRFTTEVADICQNLGFTSNELSSIQGKLDLQVADILLLKKDVAQNTANIEKNTTAITALENRMESAETRLTAAETNIKDLYSGLSTETQERIKADADLQSQITQEVNTRTTETTALNKRVDDLQTALQQEQQTRNDADQNLMNAINNEVLARQTADTALDTKIETVKASVTQEETERRAADDTLQSAIDAVSEKLDNIGDTIAPATTEKLGVVKIGTGLSITEDGLLTADAAASANIVPGDGITVEQVEGTTKISINPETVTSSIPDATDDTKGLVQTGDNITNDNGVISVPVATKESLGVVSVGNRMTVTERGEINVPVASPTTLGVMRVGNNLSVDENGVVSVVDAEGKPISSGETVEAGFGIDVTHDEEAKSATVSVQHDGTLEVNSETNEIGLSAALQEEISQNTQKLTDLDDKIDKVTDSLTGEITEIKKEIDGDQTTDPPTPGLADRVEQLETESAKITGGKNIQVTDGENDDKVVSTTETISAQMFTMEAPDLSGEVTTYGQMTAGRAGVQIRAADRAFIQFDKGGIILGNGDTNFGSDKSMPIIGVKPLENDDAAVAYSQLSEVKDRVSALEQAPAGSSYFAGKNIKIEKPEGSDASTISTTSTINVDEIQLEYADGDTTKVGATLTANGDALSISQNGGAQILLQDDRMYVGTEEAPTRIVGVADPASPLDAVNLQYVDTKTQELEGSIDSLVQEVADADARATQASSDAAAAITKADGALQKTGGTMTGVLTISENSGIILPASAISNVGTKTNRISTNGGGAAYGVVVGKTASSGSPYIGLGSVSSTPSQDAFSVIGGVATPTLNHHAANKEYVDAQSYKAVAPANFPFTCRWGGGGTSVTGTLSQDYATETYGPFVIYYPVITFTGSMTLNTSGTYSLTFSETNSNYKIIGFVPRQLTGISLGASDTQQVLYSRSGYTFKPTTAGTYTTWVCSGAVIMVKK